MEIQTAIIIAGSVVAASIIAPEVLTWFRKKKEDKDKICFDSNEYEEPTALESVNDFLRLYTGFEHTNVRYMSRTRITQDGMLMVTNQLHEPKVEIQLKLQHNRAEIIDRDTDEVLSTFHGTPDSDPITVLYLAWDNNDHRKYCVRIKFNMDGAPEIFEDTLTQVNTSMVFTVDTRYLQRNIRNTPDGEFELHFKDTFETTKIPCQDVELSFITGIKDDERVQYLSFSKSNESPHKYELDLIDKIELPNGQIFKLSEGFAYGEFESIN